MGLFEKVGAIFARRQTQPERSPGHSLWVSQRSESNIVLTDQTVVLHSTALACGTLIGRTFGMMPGQVRAARGPEDDDGTQNLRDHPVAELMNRQFNPEMSALNGKEAAILDGVYHGNSIFEIERDGRGQAIALWHIQYERVDVCRDSVTGALVYEIYNGSAPKTVLAAEDVFHLAGPNLNGGPVGMSLLSFARESIGEGLSQDRYASNFLRNQAAPSGLVTVKPGMTETGIKRLRAEIDQMYAGARKAGRVMIGDDGIDFKPIGVTPQDAEFLASRRFNVEQVCRFFGVPPQMIGDTSKQTFANFEQAGLNFLTLAIMPWVVRFEQEVNRKLLNRTAAGRARPFFKINTAAVVRANLEAQYRSFALARQWGWMSVNDIRRLLDQEPIGPDGDVYLTPMNMTPVGETPPEDGQERQDPPPANLRRVK